ncbi:competence protein CoiA [Rhizobium ruizarguesonis]|uniref:competence protein CoiA n=1 Tax=Rhizobium ruizarguesonis TaxID=2081791 RepID=UPI0037142434
MQYALVNGIRQGATPEARGVCPACKAEMMAKCGPRILHHWAHAGKRNCDPWWENETEWHRQWKNMFPEEFREISHTAIDGEIHRADIRTSTGIYVEVQHSAMTDAELRARESFYQNLVWIVDGRSFRKNFYLYHLLPGPNSELAKDIVWFEAKRGFDAVNEGMFWRRSDNPNVEPGTGEMVLSRSGQSYNDIAAAIASSYCGHQQYDWVRPRRGWLDARCPVYLDFGDEWLFRLEHYGTTALKCVLRVAKQKFVHDVMTETRAEDIAAGFHPFMD